MNINIIFILLICSFIFNTKKQKTEGSEKEFFMILKGTFVFLAFICIFIEITCFLENIIY